MLPFNVELLELTADKLKRLQPVTSLDRLDGSTDNFHDDGLFSIPIFGRVGSDDRYKNFSYINIKTKVFHPVVFNRLARLKGLYRSIMSGKTHALWDEEKKDFIPSTPLEGETGFSFFVKHWEDIEFKPTKSVERKQRIELIEKYKDRSMVNAILVMPAGLRDLRVDENGRQDEDDINNLYRKVLSVSNTIRSNSFDDNDPSLNRARHNLQNAFNEIYETLERMLTGKKGFIQSKWGSRRVFYGTRNVISSMDTSVEELGEPNAPGFDDTVVGLYQMAKSTLPVTKQMLLSGYLANVFAQGDAHVPLINKETLKPELTALDSQTMDLWSTPEGVGQFINSYAKTDGRTTPIEIDGRYLGLLYIGPDRTFRFMRSIDELPEDRKEEDVVPIAPIHLLYLSGYRRWNTFRAYITRYPITSQFSIYPSGIYVKTTNPGEMRWELDEDWSVKGDEYVALEFPKPGVESYYESMAPHASMLTPLGAD